MSRTTPMVTLKIDPYVLAHLFRLQAEAWTVHNTLSGHPYLLIECRAPEGFVDGDMVIGTVEQQEDGAVRLGVKRA